MATEVTYLSRHEPLIVGLPHSLLVLARAIRRSRFRHMRDRHYVDLELRRMNAVSRRETPNVWLEELVRVGLNASFIR